MNTNSILSSLFASLNVPVITAAIGHTSYLDEHVTPDAPIVKGVDAAGRKFFRFCVEGPNCIGMEGTAIGVVTIFQRYSDNADVWAQANNSDQCVTIVGGAVTRQEALAIKELLETGIVTMWHEGRFPLSPEDELALGANNVMTRPSGVSKYDGRPLIAVGHELKLVSVSQVEVAA